MEEGKMEMLHDHEQRLQTVEGNQREMSNQLRDLQSSSYRMETKVMEEGQETRKLLGKVLDHVLSTKKEGQKHERKVEMKQWQIIGIVVSGLFGTSGVIVLVLTAL